MIVQRFAPDKSGTAGTYWTINDIVTIQCPNCAHPLALGGYSVDEFGVVLPAVSCRVLGCAFYDFAILEQYRQHCHAQRADA